MLNTNKVMEIHFDTSSGKYIIRIMYTAVLVIVECTFSGEGGRADLAFL
jgi:hypothetical protein